MPSLGIDFGLSVAGISTCGFGTDRGGGGARKFSGGGGAGGARTVDGGGGGATGGGGGEVGTFVGDKGGSETMHPVGVFNGVPEKTFPRNTANKNNQFSKISKFFDRITC